MDTKVKQFIRFCINGCIAVAIQYGIYWLMLKAQVETNIAFTIGYVISFIYNFIATSYWTFRSRPTLKRLTGFSASHIINYFTQMAFLNIFLMMALSREFSGILAMACAVPINFIIVRFVYKAPETS